MSYGKITFLFGDGPHDFQLRIKDLKEVKEKTGCGPMQLYRDITEQNWDPNHCREIIRIGLIGGGAKPIEALDLVSRYVDNRPWIESIEPALQILIAAIFGPQDDLQVGKPQAPETMETTTSSSGAFTPAESSSA